MTPDVMINVCYLVAAVLFILGLKGMSSPVSARRGISRAGIGMLLATLVTFLTPGMSNALLIVTAMSLGVGISWWSGRTVKMTDMPQMVALYNGMGGGAAAAIAAIELVRGRNHETVTATLAALGGLIGTISFSGSLVAFLKLQGILHGTFRLRAQNALNGILAAFAIFAACSIVAGHHVSIGSITAFFFISLVLGAIMTLPIGGADMPVVISLFNAFTGLAVGFEGYVLNNPVLIIAGTVVGAAGSLLTQLMAKAMNRPLLNILFKPLTTGGKAGVTGAAGTLREISALDAAAMLRYSQKVIIVPGYGMAVGQAQHKVKELSVLLEEAGVRVKFAIHPVAGRMPGHMNVLLAEAGVPYERISDLDEINAEFSRADVALVIGANDVVNPAARTDKSSPIYGMPILNTDQARNVIVIKRGKGTGYSGIENSLFYADNTRMLYGSAQQVITDVIKHIKELLV